MRSRVTPNCDADLLERVRAAVREAEAQLEHAPLARREQLEHAAEVLALHDARPRRRSGDDRLLVLDEVAELGVALVADGVLEAHRLLADLLDLAHLARA